MSIIGTRTLSAVLSHVEWAAVAPAIKAESRRKSPRWTLLDVSGYGSDTVHLSLSVNGPYFQELDKVFSAHIPGWEQMEGVI